MFMVYLHLNFILLIRKNYNSDKKEMSCRLGTCRKMVV